MSILSKSTLVEYYTKKPKTKTVFEEGDEKAKKSAWTCYADITIRIRFVGTHKEYDAIKDIQNI